MNKYLSELGYQGPNILLTLILFTLVAQHITSPPIYALVILWQVLSHLLNVLIKNTLKMPRPDSHKDPHFADLKPTFANYLTIHRNFGMPSGHAQAMLSQLTFIGLYFQKPWLTAVAVLSTCLTLWQRYETRRHSPSQLLAGSLLGVVVGLGFYLVFPFSLHSKNTAVDIYADTDMITSL